jgi:hypothetical protein
MNDFILKKAFPLPMREGRELINMNTPQNALPSETMNTSRLLIQ